MNFLLCPHDTYGHVRVSCLLSLRIARALTRNDPAPAHLYKSSRYHIRVSPQFRFFTLEFVPNGIEVDPGIAAQTCCYVLLELAQRHAANAVKRQGKETGGVPRQVAEFMGPLRNIAGH